MSTAREEYIRVKRRNQTFFVHISPSDTFAQIKDEVSQAMGGSDVISPQQMRLYVETPKPSSDDKGEDKEMGEASMPKDPIPDMAILSDHNVKNDDVLYVTFAKSWESGGGGDVPDGDDAWEDIEIAKP
eukprot:CAMPEP_0172535494 /NCGR_PEP_ID=MMETSP1067-20121228/7480_1 /TAXON_ID=265564 ORGANISM="Thalassiosira punctigera, Strain Tpunct2005C2" /NCGR_SAMPLE_ID=MMETSP1067 /ASSEMBLY_ACC=CAM_ASM_000444 /LENGTH=128 /DNA_ID=CAMNT_0013320429 /DNA_START=299 /DNA_END=685 /DNA_ORIENTATION=+